MKRKGSAVPLLDVVLAIIILTILLVLVKTFRGSQAMDIISHQALLAKEAYRTYCHLLEGGKLDSIESSHVEFHLHINHFNRDLYVEFIHVQIEFEDGEVKVVKKRIIFRGG
ncbi:MAG: hypothetical protein DRN15_06955 [Thermoprotei archaeon]|nr:MAG: hypothetical protein DRN15_06955 [Thermoprotei archaeon]RLF24145.1 MAG: hypothetical protein DRM97_03895 [Thermoprotei archaeon]